MPTFRADNGVFQTWISSVDAAGEQENGLTSASYRDPSSLSQFHENMHILRNLAQNARPSSWHELEDELAKYGSLQRIYTTNIDGAHEKFDRLQTVIPLKDENGRWPITIQLHGTITKVICTKCGLFSDFDPEGTIFDGKKAAKCIECNPTSDVGPLEAGMLRPRIVFYDEPLFDANAIEKVKRDDYGSADILIVAGTSLKVEHTQMLVRYFGRSGSVKRIWLNVEGPPSGTKWDLDVRCRAEDVAQHLLEDMGTWS